MAITARSPLENALTRTAKGLYSSCEQLFLVRTEEDVTRSSDGSSSGFAGSASELQHSMNRGGVDHRLTLLGKLLLTVRYRPVGDHLVQPSSTPV